MREFTREDCDRIDGQTDLYRKVVVYARENLEDPSAGQLFLCIRKGRLEMADLISLANGERYLGRRADIVGTLKPELLPDEAKLHLSQICLRRRKEPAGMEPMYSGYSFLPDGRYAAGVWLYSPKEVVDYIELQKPYQHRVLICDRDDFAVFEVVGGKVVFPDGQALEEFQKGQSQDGRMAMT